MSWDPSDTAVNWMAGILGVIIFCGVVALLVWVLTSFFDPSKADATLILVSAITFLLGVSIGGAR